MSEESLFHEALAKSPGERAAFLDKACEGQPQLRAEVEALLAANEASGGFLNQPPATTTDYHPKTGPGAVIAGRYTLQEKIGQGGMGEVWVAKQTEPVKRKVALKLIKTGMDSKAVLARFEHERQALALMDHPNIAKVLDGGMTPLGQPFFVMELVNGLALSKFCDEARLTPKDRLELFVSICQAVQHAHQKGIVHRDLKPANILVTLIDGKPVPKVIDFGVAKATRGKLTEESLSTQFGAVVGTLEYMAPEQAGFSGIDVDTRADIYSLGVILYELLTGLRPINAKRLQMAAYTEMIRILREEEPSKPSTRLSTDESLPSLAALRQTEPKKLMALLRGELDWVVMKCLEKQRERRYETANGLARDIQRYLADEPVEARPPSARYRLSKFLARNKGPVTAASLVLLALIAGILGTTVGLIRADRARAAESERAEGERLAKVEAEAKRAEAEEQKARALASEKVAAERLVQVEAERQKALEEKRISQAVRYFLQNKLLGQADARKQADTLLRAGGSSEEATENPTIRELLDRAAKELAADKIEANFSKQPLLQAEILRTVGDTYHAVGDFERASEFLQRSAVLMKQHLGADHQETLTTLNNLAGAYREAGKRHEAAVLLEQVRDGRAKKQGADHDQTLSALSNLAVVYQDMGRLDEAIELLEQIRDVRARKLGPDHLEALATLHNLAWAYRAAGELGKAIELMEHVRDVRVMKLGTEHPSTLATLNNLAVAYRDADKRQESIALFEQVYAADLRIFGANHPSTLKTLHSLASAYKDEGKLSEAIVMLEQVRDGRIKKLGAEHLSTLAVMNDLAVAYQAAGKLNEATTLYQQIRDAGLKKPLANQPDLLPTLNNLATAYLEAGKPQEAIKLFEQVRDARTKKLGADHLETLLTLNNLAAAYQKSGEARKAIELFDQVRDARTKKLGADHLDTLATLHGLAVAYREVGRLSDAIELFEQVRDGQAKKIGMDHEETLKTLDDLAMTYLDASRVQEAIALFEKVRDRRVEKLGADHLDTLKTFHNLAGAYKRVGRLQEAIALYEQARDSRLRKLGADHEQTLLTLNNLAVAYIAVGRPRDAIELLEQARDVKVKKNGVEHPDTLATMHNLADAYRIASRVPEAIALFEQVRDLQIKKLGADHPSTLTTLSNLAAAYQGAGRLHESIVLFEHVRDTRVRTLGADHLDTLRTLYNLSLAYRDAGKLAEAVALLEQVRAGRVRKLGADHPETLTAGNSLALAYWRAKRFDKAVPLAEEMLELHEAKFGRQHPETLKTVANLGVDYKDAGRLTEAIPLLEEAYRASRTVGALRGVGVPLLDAYAKAHESSKATKLVQELLASARKSFPKDSPQLAGVLGGYSLTLIQAAAYSDAEPLLRECLAIREKTEPDAWTTFNTQSMLGGALLGQKKYAESEPLLVKGYEGMKQFEGKIPANGKVRLTEAAARLVQLYEAMDKKGEAAKWRKELEARKQAEVAVEGKK